MKPFLFIVSAVFASVIFALAQEDLKQLPEGPLLARAPRFSAWVIKIDRPAELKPQEGEQSKVSPTRIIVTKTESIICEQRIEKGIKSTPLWCKDNILLSLDAGDVSPSISVASGGDDIYSVDYSKADFAGLDWVSAATFSGVRKYKGRDCLVFQSEISALSVTQQRDEDAAAKEAMAKLKSQPSSGSAVAAEQSAFVPTPKVVCPAVIDFKTRLPIVATFGKEIRSYEFGEPPTQMLQLPQVFENAFNAYQSRLKRLRSQ